MSDGSNPWLSRPTEPEHAVPVVTESAVPPLDRATVERAIAGMTGPVRQMPPKYSACLLYTSDAADE